MKIGVIADGYVDANGTLDYLKIILRGLYLREGVEVYMFFSSEKERFLRHYPLPARRIYELFNKYKRNKSIDDFNDFEKLNIVEFNAWNLNRKIREYNIDVIFPAMMDLGPKVPVQWAVEFFDCQHKYYPQYFKKHILWGRDIYFNKCSRHASRVFVNSQDAKKDYCKFYNVDPAKISVLPFCASLNREFIKNNLQGIEEKYGISRPYFLVSNQFNLHKRHDVAFKALKKVRDKGYDIDIVCTGLMDWEPDLVNYLKGLVDELNLTNNVHFLNSIPKAEQIELMKRAISVLQPSAFEGDCSGQIIDAITLGQRAIASDLPVIKEVSFYKNIKFFKLDDINELSELMIEYINTPYQRPSNDELLKEEARYLEEFSKSMYEIIDSMCQIKA